MKICAAGDAIIQRRIQDDFRGYKGISDFMREADAKFFNLETTLNREGECCASQFSGGTYIRTVPEVLGDLQKFGFNMTSFNNNHALDFSYDGFLSTFKHVEASGLVHAGTGRNLAEASAPRFLETSSGRVALIAVNTTFNPAMMAGEQSARVPGRPGINGIRISKKLQVTEEELEFIKDLGKRTNINAEMEIIRKEGYYAELPENEAELGDLRFVVGDTSKYILTANEEDVERVRLAIYEASFQCDYVVVSVHSHQITGTAKEEPADYLVDMAHRFIDFGANAVVGHGPHLLRPVEIYKDSPIFYSLGDFVLQLYNVPLAPADFFAKHGVNKDSTVRDLLAKRSKNFTVGLMEDKRMFMSVIPRWETVEGKLTKLEFLPIMLKMKGNNSEIGLPFIENEQEIFNYFSEMSIKFGTKLVLREDGIIEAVLN